MHLLFSLTNSIELFVYVMILIKGKNRVICNVSEIFVFIKITHPGNALLLMGSLSCIWKFQWHNLLTFYFPLLFSYVMFIRKFEYLLTSTLLSNSTFPHKYNTNYKIWKYSVAIRICKKSTVILKLYMRSIYEKMINEILCLILYFLNCLGTVNIFPFKLLSLCLKYLWIVDVHFIWINRI